MAQAIYTMDFESDSYYEDLPTGWTLVTGDVFVNDYNPAHGGDQYLDFQGSGTNVVAMPALSSPVSGVELTFWEAFEGTSSGSFEVGYVTDVTNANSFVSVATYGLTGRTSKVYDQHTVTFPGAPAGSRIAFRQVASSYWYWFLDDISAVALSDCQAPINLTLSNLTSTSAELQWQMPGLGSYGDTTSMFQLQVVDAQGTVVINEPSLYAPLNTYSITGLTANTTYTVKIKGDCDIDYIGQSGEVTITFTTLGSAISIPYIENFDNLTELPTSYNAGATLQTSTKYGSSGKAVKIASSSSVQQAYMILPLLNVAADNFEMSVMVSGPASSTGKFMIGYVTDPSSIDGFVSILSDSTSGSAWREYRFNSASVGDQTTPIMPVIMVYAGTIYFDNVNIHLIPTCTRPEHIAVSGVTAHSAVLSWDMCNASNFLIRALNLSDSTVTTANTTASPYTMTGLDAQTSYEFTIQGVCSPIDSSEISASVSCRTLCDVALQATFLETFDNLATGLTVPECWTMGWYVQMGSTKSAPFTTSTTNKHSGSKAMTLADQGSGTVSHMSTQGLPIDMAGKYMLSVWVYRQSASSYPSEGIEFWETPNPNDTIGGVKLGKINRHYQSAPAEASAGWYNYEFLLPNAGTQYITIVGYSQYGSATYFDDMEVKLAPTCIKAKNVSFSSLTANSIDMAWEAGASETQWLLKYQLKQGTTVLADTTELVGNLAYTFANLNPATTYTISGTIRSYCGEGDTADAVSFSQTFTTLCAPMTAVPYTCGFESSEVVAYNGSSTYKMPLCWSRINDATGSSNYYPYAASGSSDAKTGSGYLKIYYDYDSDDAEHTIAVLNGVDAGAVQINGLRLKFYAKKSSSSYNNFPIIVGVMTNPDDTTTFEAVDTLFVDSYSSYEMFSVPFNNYTGNGTYIALYAPGTKSGSPFGKMYGNVYVDDLTLEEIPSCMELTGDVTASDVTENSVKITLDDATAVSGWSYAYAVSGTPVAEMTPVDTTGAFIVLNGLASVTSYDIYVRRHCGNEYSPWSAVTTFTTTSVPATMPYVCGFEDDTENASWMFVDGAGSNVFTVGTSSAGVYAGSNAMYVTSSRNSGTYTYSTSSATKSFAYRTMHFDSKGYQVELKFKSTGGEAAYDYGRIFITDASEALPSGTTGSSLSSTTFPNMIAALDAEYVTSSYPIPQLNTVTKDLGDPDADGWHTLSYFLDMTNRAGNYNLVLMWSNDASAGTASYPLSVDNINIYELTCIPPKPENVIVSALGSNSATLDIIQNDVTEWEVLVDTATFKDDVLPAAPFYRQTTTNATVSLTGLTANTDYYYAVRAICGANDTSKWNRVSKLHTLCAAVNVPYQEGFENVNSGNCWIEQGGNDKKITGRSTSQHYQGAASYVLDSATVVSPEFNVTSLAPYMITFWARATEDSAMIGLGVMTDPSDIDTYTPIGDGALIATKNTWREVTLYFSDLADPDYSDFANAKYVVLSSGAYRVYIDNIVLDEIPTCPKPTEPRITNVTAHSFDISFTNNSQSTEFVVYTNGTPHVITTNPATISGLSASTEYNVEIAAICGNDTSYTTLCGTIRTECDVMNLPYTESFETLPTTYSGPGMISSLCWSDLNANATASAPYYKGNSDVPSDGSRNLWMSSNSNQVPLYLIFPEFVSAPVGYRVSFDTKFESSTNSGNIYFGYMTDATDESTFTLLLTAPRSTGSASWAHYETEVRNLPAGARFAFKYADCASTTVYYGYIDNVKVSEIRNCSDPNTPVLSNKTHQSVDVAFTDTCAAHHNWEYVYGPAAGFDASVLTPVTLNDTTGFSLTGLTDDTEYKVAVRAVCGVGDESNWIVVSFHTECLPFAVTLTNPFSDSFEDAVDGEVYGNLCYEVSGGYHTSYSDYDITGAVNDFSSSYTYYYAHSGNACINPYVYTTYSPTGLTLARRFHFEAGKVYKAKIFAGAATTSGTHTMKFMLGTTNVSAQMRQLEQCTIPGKSYSYEYGSPTIYDYTPVYDPYETYIQIDSTGDYYLALNFRTTYSYGADFYADDFTVEESSACMPTNFTIVRTTMDSVEIAMDDQNTEHSWEYAILNGTDTVSSGVLANTDTIGGLASSTTYTISIRQICGASNYSDWKSKTFRTQCGITTLPYVCGFEASEGFQSSSSYVAGAAEAGCWDVLNSTSGSAAPYYFINSVSTYVMGGTQSFEFYGSKSTSASNQDIVAILPAFDQPTGSLLVNFDAMYEGSSSGILQFGYMTDPSDIQTWTLLYTVPKGSTYKVAIPVEVDLTQFTGIPDNARLGVRFGSGSNNWYAWIDNFNVRVCPPCREPKQAAAVTSTTMTTMTVSVPMGSKPGAQVACAVKTTGTTAADIDMTTAVTTTTGTAVLTGLTGSTTYAVFYRYLCEDNDTSAWSPMCTGTTTSTDCFDPQNVHVVGMLDDHHAELTWGKAPLAVTYEWELKKNNVLVASGDTAAALIDTLVFDTLQPVSNYTFRVRGICGTNVGDTSAWKSVSFSTTNMTYSVPYVCNFETTDEEAMWSMTVSTVSSFVIGTAESNGGQKGMYASEDGGASADYSSNSSSVAVSLIAMQAGDYMVSFDWKCKGESSYDYGLAYLVPASVEIGAAQCVYTSIPTEAISLMGDALRLNLQEAWQTQQSMVTLPNAGVYQLVFTWRSDGSQQYSPALCVDNVNIQRVLCMHVDNVTIGDYTSTRATVTVRKHSNVAIEYAISTVNDETAIQQFTSKDNGQLADTLVFTGLTEATDYYVFVRQVCDEQTVSPCRVASFKTPASAVNVPYVCSFEQSDNVSAWETSSQQSNYFCIGNATSSAGQRALYVTSDGSSYDYNISSTSTSYAYIPLSFGPGVYDVEYKWVCMGEGTYDYGHVFMVSPANLPADGITGGMSASAVPTNAISLDGNFAKLSEVSEWQTVQSEVSFTDSTVMYLVVAWHNDGSMSNGNPLAIDELSITKQTCMKLMVENMRLDTVSTDMFTLKYKNLNEGATTNYAVSLHNDFSDTLASGILAATDSLLTMTNLLPGTVYYISLQSNCGAEDGMSKATVVNIRTNCDTIRVFPYSEDFESLEPLYTTSLEDGCFLVSPQSTTDFFATVGTSTVHGGSQAMYINHGYDDETVQYVMLPPMANLNGKNVSFWYKAYDTYYYYCTMSVGYVSNNTFTQLDAVTSSTSWNKYERTLQNIPAGARLALEFIGEYYYYVDDIRINDLVQGQQYSDTICHGSNYQGHGVSKLSTELQDGDNIFTETVLSNTPGVADSLVSLNIYVRPELRQDIYDTICEGQPYNKNGFNIANPNPAITPRITQQDPQTGCSSTVYLHLTVMSLNETIDTTICQGDAVSFEGQTYTLPGTYNIQRQTPYGCTQNITLNVAVVDSVITTNATICNGESYTFEGNTYRIAGTYRVPGTGSHGCPVTKVLNLTVVQNDTTVNVTFCRGGFVMVDGIKISTFGQIDTARWDASIGCYRNYHITATEKTIPAQSVTDEVCEGHPYYGNGLNGVIITNDTIYDVTTKTAEMCDSVTHVSIHVIKTVYSSFDADIKEGDSYRWNDEDFTVEGSYERTFQSTVTGCDSVVTLRLHVSPVGVENVTSVKVDVVPNPVTAGMTAYVYGDFGEVENVEILNNFGQVVDRFVPSTYPIEVQGIEASGLYYVRVNTTDGKVYTEKLIVK